VGGKSILTAFFEWVVHWVSIEMAGCWLTKINVLTLHIRKRWQSMLFIFVYLCSEIHNFHLCGTPNALLDKNMLTPHISDLRKARFVFNHTCSEIFLQNSTNFVLVSLAHNEYQDLDSVEAI